MFSRARNLWCDLWRRTEAASNLEYAVLLGLVGTAVIGGLLLLGQQTKSGLGLAGAGLPDSAGAAPTSHPSATVTRNNLQWRYFFGNWTSDGSGSQSSDDLWSFAVAETGSPNYTASLTMQTTKPGADNVWDVTRMVYRFQDPNNYYAVVPKTDGTLELAKMQDGVWRPWLSYAKAGIDSTVQHTYQVTVTGNRSQVSVDGVKYIDYVDNKGLPVGGSVGVVNSWSQGTFGDVAVSKR